MTLRKILDDIALRMPHAFSEDQVVLFLNKVLKDIGRCCARIEAEEKNTVEGREIYPLPTYIRPEGIKSVTIGDKAYEPALIEEGVRNRQYYFPISGYIAFNPTPEKAGETIRIVFEDHTEFLTLKEIGELHPLYTDEEKQEAFDTQVAGILDYYTELLELGVFIIIANATEDIDLANNYTLQYNAKKEEASYAKYMQRGKYPVTKCRV